MRLRDLSRWVCVIVLVTIGFGFGASSARGDDLADGKVTFTEDVAPIFMANCARCHRPGEIAPMSLLTFEESRPWAKSIKQVVVARDMPPWFADREIGKFSNDPSLTEREIDIISRWVDQGARSIHSRKRRDNHYRAAPSSVAGEGARTDRSADASQEVADAGGPAR